MLELGVGGWAVWKGIPGEQHVQTLGGAKRCETAGLVPGPEGSWPWLHLSSPPCVPSAGPLGSTDQVHYPLR